MSSKTSRNLNSSAKKWKKVSLAESTWLKAHKLRGNKTFNDYIGQAINSDRRLREENKLLKLEIERLKENNGHSALINYNDDKNGNCSECDFFTLTSKPNMVDCRKDWINKGKIRHVTLEVCQKCWCWVKTELTDEVLTD